MTTKIIKNSSPRSLSHTLTISIMGIAAILMFGLAYTANAALLYRQLDLGTRGSDVSDLQTFLAQDSARYPSGLVTGYFGQLTKAGVERFQTAQGIVHAGTPATTGYGRVGPLTMAAINAQMGGSPIGGSPTGYDTYAPVISSLSVSVTNSTMVLNWNTSENASAVIYYSTSPIYMTEGSPTSAITISGSSYLVHADLRSSHSAILTGLQANTTYYYVVYVRDASGNENITWPATASTN